MAETTVDASSLTDLDTAQGLRGPYWLSPSVGVIFYITNASDLVYRRTTDGGTYGAEQTVYSGATNPVRYLDAYSDMEVPGDGGDKVHLAFLVSQADELLYVNYDLGTDTVGTVRDVDTTINVSTVELDHRVCITKTRGGNILVGAHGDGGSLELYAYKSADEFATAGTAIADLYESSQFDYAFMWPANTGDDDDVIAVFYDDSAEELTLKLYDDSGDVWNEVSPALVTAMDTRTGGSPFPFDGAIRNSDGHLLLCAHEDQGVSHDQLTWDINPNSVTSPSITAKTSVQTATTEEGQSVFINQKNDDVYIVYASGSWLGSNSVQYKLSTDGMATWGSETQYNATNRDYRLITAGRSVTVAGGRFQPVLWDKSAASIFVNLDNDIEIVGGESFDGVGGVTPTGALTLFITANTYAGAITPAGVLTTFLPLETALAAGMTPAGVVTVTLTLSAALAAGMTPAGTESMLQYHNVTPSTIVVGPGDVTTPLITALPAGAITPAGAQDSSVTLVFAGVITPAATLTKHLLATMAGAISPIGVFNIFRPPLKVVGRMRAVIADRLGNKLGDIL